MKKTLKTLEETFPMKLILLVGSILQTVLLIFVEGIVGRIALIVLLLLSILLLGYYSYLRFQEKYENSLNKLADKISVRTYRRTIFLIEEERRKKYQILNENAYQHTAQRYGIGYSDLKVEVTISPDGSGEIKRIVTVQSYSHLGELDTYLLFPEMEEVEKSVEVNCETHRMEYEVVESKQGKKSLSLRLNPPLTDGEELVYELKEWFPKGTYAINMPQSEINLRENPIEYAGWNITRPTRQFTFMMFFPVGILVHKPDVAFSVKYALSTGGTSERYQPLEQRRISLKKLDSGNRQQLVLDVPYPMVGLIYMIEWAPISREGE